MIQEFEYDYKGSLCSSPKGSSKNELKFMQDSVGDCMYHTELPNQLGLSIFSFTPRETTTMQERMAESDFCMMSFCLGGNMEWSLAEVPSKLYIEQNESCIMTGGTERCISLYEKDVLYRGIGLSFNPTYLQGVTKCLQCENAVNNCLGLASGGLKRYVITPHVLALLSQLVDCNICDRLKSLYLEAKLLELIAVYLDEMVCQYGDELPELSLSKEDMHALTRAKEILDKTFAHPLTLSELSRKVYINEYKLKTGFKQRYGYTVYGYILEKRMELAKILIEQRRFKVGDIAGMVGYANTSHFISAFSKKYDVTPGELLRR